MHKKGYFWDPTTCSCKNGKYARSIGDSGVICNEILEKTKLFQQKILQKTLFQQKVLRQIFTFY